MSQIKQHTNFLNELSCHLQQLGCYAILSQSKQDPYTPYDNMIIAKVSKHHLLKDITHKIKGTFKVESIMYDPDEDRQMLTINLGKVILHLMCECDQCLTPRQSISFDDASLIA